MIMFKRLSLTIFLSFFLCGCPPKSPQEAASLFIEQIRTKNTSALKNIFDSNSQSNLISNDELELLTEEVSKLDLYWGEEDFKELGTTSQNKYYELEILARPKGAEELLHHEPYLKLIFRCKLKSCTLFYYRRLSNNH